jgi:hypothetical protein
LAESVVRRFAILSLMMAGRSQGGKRFSPDDGVYRLRAAMILDAAATFTAH